MKLKTAEKIKKLLEESWRCKVEICKDYTNHLKVKPADEKLPNERWFIIPYLKDILSEVAWIDLAIYVDFNERCLIIYGEE